MVQLSAKDVRCEDEYTLYITLRCTHYDSKSNLVLSGRFSQRFNIQVHNIVKAYTILIN